MPAVPSPASETDTMCQRVRSFIGEVVIPLEQDAFRHGSTMACGSGCRTWPGKPVSWLPRRRPSSAVAASASRQLRGYSRRPGVTEEWGS